MDKQNIKAFFDMLAPEWDNGQIIEETKINHILDSAKVKAGCRVLDIACGTGVLFPFYLQRECAEIVGVDISSAMCELAAAKFADIDKITILNCDAAELPKEQFAEHFDCCMIYNAFPHFTDPQKLISCLTPLLKKNGTITIAHSMGKDRINAHHSGEASSVSRGLDAADKTALLFTDNFAIDYILDEEEIYLISAHKK
ncbi:MAG: class I SAM-dependent methyltransferase [Firmicutes bacterium]|nr:class I SAM-dependent methyltransferase [Bacillota bacterium]